jgi:hypothetical protein
MTSAVTAPLERQFGQMPGLDQMSSTSSGGASVVTLRFAWTWGLDVAEQQVQAAINAASHLLPSDLPAPPTLQQGQSGRRAHPDPGHHLPQPALPHARPGGYAAWRRRSPRSAASAW